ncbi:hypothetical protein KSP39_PZI000496 [Platanthera zijinensis]|uniref:Uncharacterized protein n=1 Tax=Platanthera zijinensis TaxID=2320716 RepID=A0AAP0C0Y2_9ASPA
MTTKPPVTTGEAPSRPTALTHAIGAKPHHRRKHYQGHCTPASLRRHVRTAEEKFCQGHCTTAGLRRHARTTSSPPRLANNLSSKTGGYHLQSREMRRGFHVGERNKARLAPTPSMPPHGVAPPATTGGGDLPSTRARATRTPSRGGSSFP